MGVTKKLALVGRRDPMNMSTNSGMSDGKTSPNISSAKKADIEQRRETLQSQIADAKKEARAPHSPAPLLPGCFAAAAPSPAAADREGVLVCAQLELALAEEAAEAEQLPGAAPGSAAPPPTDSASLAEHEACRALVERLETEIGLNRTLLVEVKAPSNPPLLPSPFRCGSG